MPNKTDEKVRGELDVAVGATRLDVVELEFSFESAMRVKSQKNMINFV